MAYSIGLDYGTNSVRCVIVDIKNGNEIGTNVYNYPTGQAGIIIDRKDHNDARQNPADYLEGIVVTVKKSIAQAKRNRKGFKPEQIIGIGVDTTGSTPLSVNKNGVPLALTKEFRKNPNAHAWLWKDHTGHAEAAEITALAKKEHLEYPAKCGGISEKNTLVMQIYADVISRKMKITCSAQACALSAVIAGAFVAGKVASGYGNCSNAQAAMCGITALLTINWLKLIELILTFFAQISWPIVTLILLIIFRKPIYRILQRIKSVSTGNHCVKFEDPNFSGKEEDNGVSQKIIETDSKKL